MKKRIVILCVMNAVFLCHSSVFVATVLAEDDTVNVAAEQTEPGNTAIEVEEATHETTDDSAITSDTAPDSTSGNGDAKAVKEVDAKQLSRLTATTVSSNAEPAKKPLIVDGLVLTDAERRVFELTNAERQKRGLPPLRLDRRLMESARRQANWMARTSIFRHGNSGFSENIAMGQRNGLEVVKDWIRSPGHFRNMMSRNHGAIGIGTCRGRNGQLYWCQQFSR